MNSFETDLRRAVLSLRFFAGLALQFAVLWQEGFGSTLYKMSVPLVCAFPYACGWLDEYKGGFFKLALARTSRRGYVWGKFLACAASGGGLEALAAWLWAGAKQLEAPPCDYGLVFLSAAVWAGAAAVLAALSNSKYLAYGGGFVVYYFLVILCERYWQDLYCLYPYEWLAPAHTWPFGSTGTAGLLAALLLALGLWHKQILEGRIEHG